MCGWSERGSSDSGSTGHESYSKNPPYHPSIRAAAEYGLDLTLFAANLRRMPTERCWHFDAMVDFQRRFSAVGASSAPRSSSSSSRC